MYDGRKPLIESPEIEHSLEELTQLYDYLIDNYGTDSQHEQRDFTVIREWPELPKLTGWAALKYTLTGHLPNPATLPLLPTYTKTERTVAMPIVPARNPNDSRSAALFRRYTPARAKYPEDTTILLESWTQRSAEESRRRGLGGVAGRTFDGYTHRLVKEDPRPGTQKYKQNETGDLWFQYLTKVKEYRDSGEYDRSGYDPFIEQNIDLLRAVEDQMDLHESNREVKRDAKLAFDQEQIDQSKQLIQGWLADVPVPEWHHVPHWPGFNGSDAGDYDTRSRRVELRGTDGSPLPTLSITEVQTNNEPVDLFGKREGLLTRYNIRLHTDGENLMWYAYNGDFTPRLRSYPEPKDKDQHVSELARQIVDESTIKSIEDRVKMFQDFGTNTLLTQAICNEVMAKYREFEEQGRVTKIVVEGKE